MNKTIYKAHFAILAANIIYGINYIIVKGIMPDKVSPATFVFIRLLCCTALFWIAKSFFAPEKVESKDFSRLILCGLFGAAVNMMFFFHGINLTSPIDASIIMTVTPVIVIIFSYFILKERINKNKIIGIIVGGIGAILLIIYGDKTAGGSSVLGNLFVFLNATFYGLYLVIAKTLMKKYNAITVVSWMFLFGLIFVTPFSITDFLNTNFENFTLDTYLTLAYVVLFTTFLTFLFNIYSLKHVSPAVTSSYTYLQPVISFIMVSIFAYVLMKTEYTQDISILKVLSCLLVVIGVYTTSKQTNKLT